MPGYRFAYEPPTVRGGSGSVAGLADELAMGGHERAFVVTGRNVGTNDAVMGPVRNALDDRLAGIFAETAPEKRLSTAIKGCSEAQSSDADVIVGVGGGSSLDIAKIIAALHAVDRPATIGAELAERGTFTIPADDVPPIVVVPTTLAGADLTHVAGVTAEPQTCPVDASVAGGISDPRLMPSVTIYDPELFAATPVDVLAGSAMNGFDKGVETLYAQNATPVTDATAAEGLSRIAPGLHALRDRPGDTDVLERVLDGLLLVQYGVSRADGMTLSVIHALGHGITRISSVQQGVAHAILAPHVLAYLFGRVDANRKRLARALRVPAGSDLARGIVDEVSGVRNALELPKRLREVDGPTPEEFETAASIAIDDPLLANAPADLDPTVEEFVEILETAH